MGVTGFLRFLGVLGLDENRDFADFELEKRVKKALKKRLKIEAKERHSLRLKLRDLSWASSSGRVLNH